MTGVQVLVRTAIGHTVALTVECACCDTFQVDDLKKKLEDREGIPPEEFRLLSGFKELRDGDIISKTEVL